MLQKKAEYTPLVNTDAVLPVVRPAPRGGRFFFTYGVPVLIVLNVATLIMVGVQLHRPTIAATTVRQGDALHAKDSLRSTDGVLPASLLPAKFSVSHVTPYKDQAGRGTCWDFGTIGALEQSYRKHGIEQGWLHPNEYVSFSEQAYGIEVMEMCSGPANSSQQKACRIADDNVWRNSTEGGEVPILYYLQNSLHESVLPTSVCPYARRLDHDWDCPGLSHATTTNPLSFELKHMDTYYDLVTVKQQLVAQATAMPLSTTLVAVKHFYPCVGAFAKDPRCHVDVCALCPPELPMATCCLPADDSDGQNMEGEFFSHSGMSVDGGHVMLLVAYNDLFRTREGATGGLIVKNSWADGWTGSHSLQYWMQNISEWEERVLCPNSANPFNWYTPTEDDGLTDIAACLSPDSVQYAALNRQPLHLTCDDLDLCVEGRQYFAKNRTAWGDRMHIMCFWEYEPATNSSRHLCLPPMLREAIADVFSPVETYKNDPDVCGFYFLPYETIRTVSALFDGFFVNNMDVNWAPQSYLANRAQFPQFDYSLLEASTKTQQVVDFDGPFPYAHVYKQHASRRHGRKSPMA
ncbi:Aste57867_13380 [Aphanomyces stellatus]|uniref:Aste57867_13380 protein n=1 Tax=Aphanomyces stellatus TaxID=120398 RepID=A0A485KYA4_9STRA|nr:hypothetical protein As57867_013330 [Aphanomyces stellatus]VFT90219.1 Aste57867_13380 [Aphanomyces stellatus]